MKFEFDLNEALFKPGKYNVTVDAATLHTKEETGYQGIKVTCVISDDSPQSGTKFTHMVAMPDPSNKYYGLQLKNMQEFLSACAGRKLEGTVELNAESDLNGDTYFPDLVGESFDCYLETDGDFIRIKRNGFIISDPF
jgi:hypothetical protein